MSNKPRSRRARSIEPDEVEPTAPEPAKAGQAREPASPAKQPAKATKQPAKATKQPAKATKQPAKPANQARQPKRAAPPQALPVERAAIAPRPASEVQESKGLARERTGVPALTVIEGFGLRSERAWAARVASNAEARVSEPEPATGTAIVPEPLEAVVSEHEPTKDSGPEPEPATGTAIEPEPLEAVVSVPKRRRFRRPIGIPPELLAWPRRRRTSVRSTDSSSRQTGRSSLPIVGSGSEANRAGRRALAVVCLVSLLIASPLVIDALLNAGSGARSGVAPTVRAPEETRAVQVGGVTSMQETFDGLPMDSELPDPWVLRDGEAVRIVALPTSVDRSARLVSGADGAPTTACLPVGAVRAPELTIVVEYQVGRSMASPAMLLSLESGGAQTLALLIDPAGVPIGVTAPGELRGATVAPPSKQPRAVDPASPAWHRVELTVAMVSGEVTWWAQDSSGAEAGSGSVTAEGLGAARIEVLCLHSPKGQPAAWVAVDDLVIQG